MRRRASRLCGRCKRVRPHVARDLCVSCYHYVRRPYVPTGAGMGGPGVLRDACSLAGRLEDYAEIRARHYTIGQAAKRLGVSVRTADRYEARLREKEGQAA